MFGWNDLKKNILDSNGSSFCPVEGCKAILDRQSGSFRKELRFQCPVHHIYVSPSTFEYPEETDNMLWKNELDLSLWSLIKQPGVKRESRLARDRSEDAVVWNVFRYLERMQLVERWLKVAIEEDVEDANIIYWSLCQRLHKAWPPLLDTCPLFGEKVERRSEPDVVLTSRHLIVFVEAKYGSVNAKSSSKAKKYESGFNGWFKTVFKQDTTFNAIADDSEMYQLLRHWLIGSCIAEKERKRFVLVNLVREAADNDIEQLFGGHCQQNSQRRFVRATWEQIYNQIVVPQPSSEPKLQMLNYFRNRTLGYKVRKERASLRRILQKAFCLEQPDAASQSTS